MPIVEEERKKEMSELDFVKISMAIFLSRIARAVVRDGQGGEAVSIEHRGKVIRQLVLRPDGKADDEAIG